MGQKQADNSSRSEMTGVPPDPDQVDAMGIADSLERILNASSASPLPEEADRGAHERLLKVSQQLADCEFGVSPVLTRLVDAAIGGLPILPSEDYQQMCIAVANTLFDDTGARERLERLWHQLQKES